MMQYLNAHDIAEFEKRYPAAYSFLLGRALEGEKVALRREQESSYITPERRGWIENRLAELTQFD